MKKFALTFTMTMIAVAVWAITPTDNNKTDNNKTETTTETTVELAEASDYSYVYFDNKCSSSVKYSIKVPGGGSSGSVNAKYKKRMTLKIGSKVYINGDFYKEVSASDDGDTWTICK